MLGTKDVFAKSTEIEITVWVSGGVAEIYEYFFVNDIKRDTLDEEPAWKNLFLF